MTRLVTLNELNSRVLETRNAQTPIGQIPIKSKYEFTQEDLNAINGNAELRATVISYLSRNGWFVSNPSGSVVDDRRFGGNPLGTDNATFTAHAIIDSKAGSYINLGRTNAVGAIPDFEGTITHEVAHWVNRGADALYWHVALANRKDPALAFNSAVESIFGTEARATATELYLNGGDPNYVPPYMNFGIQPVPAPLQAAFVALRQGVVADLYGVHLLTRMNYCGTLRGHCKNTRPRVFALR
jgi:hypothetical protein